MYNIKSHYGFSPRAINGLFDGFSKAFNDESWAGITVPVNIKETDKEYELHLVAPGLKKEDFKISLDKNILNISFEQKEEAKEEGAKWLRNEYRFRSFKRSFTLNEKVNSSAISAKYNDGILNISLPKKENVEASTQEISVA